MGSPKERKGSQLSVLKEESKGNYQSTLDFGRGESGFEREGKSKGLRINMRKSEGGSPKILKGDLSPGKYSSLAFVKQ